MLEAYCWPMSVAPGEPVAARVAAMAPRRPGRLDRSLMRNATLPVKASKSRSIHDVGPWIEEIRHFIGVETRPVLADRVLSSVLFTDIVDSSRRAAELSDAAWKRLLGRHDEVARDRLERLGWRFVHTTAGGTSTPYAETRC